MVDGIKKRDGTILDYGTRLNKSTVIRALKSLIKLNIVEVEKTKSAEKGHETNNYRLKFEPEPVVKQNLDNNSTADLNTNTLVAENDKGVVAESDKGLSQKTTSLVAESDIQDTALQNKAKQKKEITTTIPEPKVEDADKQNVVVALLVDFGITRKVAEELALKNDPLYLQKKLAYAKFLLEFAPEKIKSPKGWLVKAIGQDYAAPDGFISQEDHEALKKQREIMQQRQEEEAKLEAARQEKKAELEAQNYEQWRNDLSKKYGTTQKDFELWQRALVGLKSAFSSNAMTYSSFVEGAEILCVQDGKVLLGVGSQYAVDKLNHRNNVYFEREFKLIFEKHMKVEFVVVGSPRPVSEELTL